MEDLFAPPGKMPVSEAIESSPSGAVDLFAPPKKRSAQDIIGWAVYNKQSWKDTSEQLKKEGYKPSPEFGKQFDQQIALKTEQEKQGTGVGTIEQFTRNAIPVGSALLNSRRESSNAEAMKRYQAGKATPEDIQTIATYQRRQDADREINSTLGGQLLNVVGQAPAIVGEAVGAGKVLGLASKATGIGQAARAPLAAAVNPSMGRAAMNFAGKQAIMTPLMPSMFLAHANQKNIEEGRDPNDVRGFAPALALGYVNNLVLGSLQKFGNVGSFPRQIANKAAIGVGEQAIGDVATGAADEFLNKSYKMGTRYGVLGNFARGEFGKGFEHATVQAFTFGYFAALHGKQPQRVVDAYKSLLDANAEAGLSPVAAAKVASDIGDTLSSHLKQRIARASNDAFEAGREFTAADARNLFQNVDAATKGMTTSQKAAVKKYVEELANVFPEKKAREKRPIDPVVEDAELRMGDEGPVAERPEPIEVSVPRPEAPRPEVAKDPLADYPPDFVEQYALGWGVKAKALKDPVVRAQLAKALLNSNFATETAPAEPPRAERPVERPPAPPEVIAPPAQRQRESLLLAPGTKTREKNHHGIELVRHDVTDASGNVVGDAKVFQRDNKLHVHWIGAKGLAGGEGRGDNPFGARELLKLLPELARAYPDAEFAVYTPAEGRIKAGETKMIDLARVRERSAERPAEVKPEPVPVSEPTPPPKVTTAEKIAPDKVAFFPPSTPPKVAAERRSAPRPERKADPATEVTELERRQDQRIAARDARTTYDQVPAVLRKRLEAILPTVASKGLNAEAFKERVRSIYVAAGLDGAKAIIERYEADHSPTHELNKLHELADQNARRAEEEYANATDAITRDQRVADNAELVRKLRERLARDQEEADRVADQAINGRRSEKKAQAGKPRQEKGKVETPRGQIEVFRDRAPEAVKDYLDAALHNMKRGDREAELSPAERQRDALDRVTAAQIEAARAGDTAAFKELERVVTALGGTRAGPAKGKFTGFDGSKYESDTSVFTGDKVKVVERPIVLGDYLVRKGKVTAQVSVPRTGEGTLLKYIRGYGGIDPKSMSPRDVAILKENGFGDVFRSDKLKGGSNAIDTLAEHLQREGYIERSEKKTPVQALLDALESGKVVNEGRDYEKELKEHYGDDTAGEWKPSEEEIPFSRGDRSRGEKPSPEGKVGPFEIIAAQDKIFGVKNYVESGVPGAPGDVGAAARIKERATVTGKKAAGSEEVNLEEHAHHLQRDYKLPIDPSEFPLPVARGIQEFFGDRVEAYGGKKGGPPTRLGMIEGFADWLISRSRNDLKDLTPNQQIANEYLERWAASKGLTEKFDQVKELYARMNTSAAANVSATGKPVEADRTAGDRFEELTNKAEEVVDNDLSALRRLTKAARKLGYKFGIGEDPEMVYSQLMHADKARAGLFERDGVFTYVDGRRVQIGESLVKITEGGRAEWLQPGENGEASRAGTYAVARHILGEANRGNESLVSASQLEGFRKFIEESKADGEFHSWAEKFADRLTGAFNATREALAGKDVHFLSSEEVKAWKEKYPDYIPTERVKQEGWKAGSGTRGESPRSLTGERSGSGEQIVDPLITYKNRLRVTSAVMGEQLKRIAVEKLLKHPGMGNWGISTGEQVKTELGQLRTEKLKELGFSGEELHAVLKDMGLARAEEYFTTKPWPTDGSKPTWGLKNADGKLVNYRIGDRALYDLITGQQVEANALASWLKATGDFLPVKLMTQAVKFGATSASLGFQFRNVPRDIYSFWSNTIDRMKANPRDLGDAYKRAYAFAWHQLIGHFGKGGSTDVLFKRFADERGDQLRQFAFDKDNPISAYDAPKTGAIKTASTVWGILKDTLNLTGAGELAPRFLEWKTRLQQTTGKSEKELTEMLEAAEKATAEGRRVPDPIPLGVAIDAMNAAAEVTTNFNRLGSVTRQMNKITPFFGPAIAGLSKQVRNWKDNPKGAAFALSGLLAARLLHWVMFSDEEWYKELNSNDKYNNFVVPTPAGLRRLPAPRGLEVAGGGFLITALDAAAGKNPDLKGYLKESLTGNLPPAPVPPVAKVGYEIATNENWMGSPIVPRREEKASTVDKWIDHRAGYAADQLTGGLVSERRVPTSANDAIPYTEVRNARRTVDDFFDKYEDMQEAKRKAELSGLIYKENAEYQRMNAARRQIIDAGRAIRGERLVNGKVVKGEEPPEERKKELRAKQLELAKKAMGRP